MNDSVTPQNAAFNCPNCGAAATPDSTLCPYCRSALSVKICASCYGAVSIGMKHCPSCGAEIANPQPTTAESRLCPRCECGLEKQAVGKHILHSCNQCGGLWVDKNSFQDICTQEEDQEAVLGYEPPESPQPATRKPQRAYIPCPECKKLMNHKNFALSSGIVLDWCRDHGSWLDRHELHRIITFIRNGGMRKAREKEKSQLKEQEDRLRMQKFQFMAVSNRLRANIDGIETVQSEDSLLKFFSRMFR
jgi:Zn-finger nucleic acid-binding protein